MKRIIILILVMILAAAIAGCASDENNYTKEQEAQVTQEQKPTEDTESTEYDFGAKTALEKKEFTIEEMLEYAIQDEYLARQEYELIMDEYGEQKPFSNIIKAEENHIEMLKGIYAKYDYDIPEDNAIDYAVLPNSLEEAFDIGVQAEIDNIAMYELFLEAELPDDIRAVFIELRDGSKNHLAAFEKGVRGNGRNG